MENNLHLQWVASLLLKTAADKSKMDTVYGEEILQRCLKENAAVSI